MSFSEETKQIMKHYLELYLNGTIIREEQDVLDAYVEEIKNSTNPEDIAFVSTYQGKVNKTREETLAKETEMKENGEVRVLKLNNPNGYVKVITIISAVIIAGVGLAITILFMKCISQLKVDNYLM